MQQAQQGVCIVSRQSIKLERAAKVERIGRRDRFTLPRLAMHYATFGRFGMHYYLPPRQGPTSTHTSLVANARKTPPHLLDIQTLLWDDRRKEEYMCVTLSDKWHCR